MKAERYLEKKNFSGPSGIYLSWGVNADIARSVPLPHFRSNREIVEERRYGAGEGRGVRRGPCSNAGIWGASFAPLCAVALQLRAKACPRWISSSFPGGHIHPQQTQISISEVPSPAFLLFSDTFPGYFLLSQSAREHVSYPYLVTQIYQFA